MAALYMHQNYYAHYCRFLATRPTWLYFIYRCFFFLFLNDQKLIKTSIVVSQQQQSSDCSAVVRVHSKRD